MVTAASEITTGPEARVVAALATQAAGPRQLERGELYALPDGLSVHDLERFADYPLRKRGTVTVRDARSFSTYLGKHEVDGDTEIFADPGTFELVAVLDSHGRGLAGWREHRLVLGLAHTPAWKAWAKLDRQLLPQQQFAEHLEDRLVDVVRPSGADMLELAQTFHATKAAAFESSQRLSTGEVQLSYKEDVEAKAGRAGRLSIPETFDLALVPFEGAKAYKVTARLRYRLHDAHLVIGYTLERPEDVLRAAFDDVLSEVAASTESPVLLGRP